MGVSVFVQMQHKYIGQWALSVNTRAHSLTHVRTH